LPPLPPGAPPPPLPAGFGVSEAEQATAITPANSSASTDRWLMLRELLI
jgi:hypothetical protein